MRKAERLTEVAPAWHAATTRARAALEQAEELGSLLEQLGERLGK
jgi:hypothetical protein